MSGLSPAVLSQLPQQPTQLSRLLQSVSGHLGTIRSVKAPPYSWEGPIVFHVQDIHLNSEAQSNIGKAVDQLMINNQIDLIALEGAFRSIDLSRFRSFSDRDALRKAANYALKKNEITGPVHAALTSRGPIPNVAGVDDSTAYRANVEAYRQSVPVREAMKKSHSDWTTAIAEQSRQHMNATLYSLWQKSSAYHEGQMTIGDYLRALASFSPALSSDLNRFLQALSLEQKLNFSEVKNQRDRLVRSLVPRLTPSEIDRFARLGADQRSGRLSQGLYYEYLKKLCGQKGLRLKDFPFMEDYIDYLILSGKIEAEDLLVSLQKLETEVYKQLTHTSVEKRLIEETNEARLVGKLIDFSLTKEEWEEYNQIPVPSPLGERARVRASEALRFPSPGLRPPSPVPGEGTSLEMFEEFYKQAEIRDEMMANNLLKKAKRGTAILVTGGFHSTGIQQRLVNAGCTVVTFVPRITHIENMSGAESLSLFTQQKAPLESLFEGQKLFLSQNPVALEHLPLEVVAVKKIISPMVNSQTVVDNLLPPGHQTTVESEREGNQVNLTVTTDLGSIENTFEMESDGDIVSDRIIPINPLPELITGLLLYFTGVGLTAPPLEFVSLFLIASMVVRATWFSVIYRHGLGHVVMKWLVDNDYTFSWVEAFEGLTPKEVLSGLFPFLSIHTPWVSPRKSISTGDTDPDKVFYKAFGGPLFNLAGFTLEAGFLFAVHQGLFSINPFLNVMLWASLVLNFVFGVMSISDFVSMKTGLAPEGFACGWLDYVRKRVKGTDGASLMPEEDISIIEKATYILSKRGRQAYGWRIKARKNGHAALVGTKDTNPKRSRLHQRLGRELREIPLEAEEQGYEPLDDIIDYASHLRFGTSSWPSVAETHPHDTPARLMRRWSWSDPNVGLEQVIDNHQLSVRHNGDNDGLRQDDEVLSDYPKFVFLQETSYKKIRQELNRINYYDPTKGDSPALASLLDIYHVKGDVPGALRLSYLTNIPGKLELAFPGLKNPTQVNQRIQLWANVFEKEFARHIESNQMFVKRKGQWVPNGPYIKSTLLPGMKAAFADYLKQNNDPFLGHLLNDENKNEFDAFVETALFGFFQNDIVWATKLLMGTAQDSSTFGLSISSTLQPELKVWVAKGQPGALGYRPKTGAFIGASDPGAVLAGLDSESKLLTFNDDHGEIVVLNMADENPKPTIFNMSKYRALTDAEIEARWIPIANNPYMSIPYIPSKDDVRSNPKRDLAELNKVLVEVVDSLDVRHRENPTKPSNRITADEWKKVIHQMAREYQAWRLEKLRAWVAQGNAIDDFPEEKRQQVDILFIAEGYSYDVALRKMEDLEAICPGLHVRVVTGNEFMQNEEAYISGKDGARFSIGKNTMVFAVSQSGMTFSEVHSVRSAQSLKNQGRLRDVFVMTGEWFSVLGRSTGQEYFPTSEFKGRIFSNRSGARQSAAATMTDASDFLFTKLFTELFLSFKEADFGSEPKVAKKTNVLIVADHGHVTMEEALDVRAEIQTRYPWLHVNIVGIDEFIDEEKRRDYFSWEHKAIKLDRDSVALFVGPSQLSAIGTEALLDAHLIKGTGNLKDVLLISDDEDAVEKLGTYPAFAMERQIYANSKAHGAFNLQMSKEALLQLEADTEPLLKDGVADITGTDAAGIERTTPIHQTHLQVGKRFSNMISEQFFAVIAVRVYTFLSVLFHIPIFKLIAGAIVITMIALNGSIHSFSDVLHAVMAIESLLLFGVGMAAHILDTIFYTFQDLWFTYLIRSLQKRSLFDRVGPRALVIASDQWESLRRFFRDVLLEGFGWLQWASIDGGKPTGESMHRNTDPSAGAVALVQFNNRAIATIAQKRGASAAEMSGKQTDGVRNSSRNAGPHIFFNTTAPTDNRFFTAEVGDQNTLSPENPLSRDAMYLTFRQRWFDDLKFLIGGQVIAAEMGANLAQVKISFYERTTNTWTAYLLEKLAAQVSVLYSQVAVVTFSRLMQIVFKTAPQNQLFDEGIGQSGLTVFTTQLVPPKPLDAGATYRDIRVIAKQYVENGFDESMDWVPEGVISLTLARLYNPPNEGPPSKEPISPVKLDDGDKPVETPEPVEVIKTRKLVSGSLVGRSKKKTTLYSPLAAGVFVLGSLVQDPNTMQPILVTLLSSPLFLLIVAGFIVFFSAQHVSPWTRPNVEMLQERIAPAVFGGMTTIENGAIVELAQTANETAAKPAAPDASSLDSFFASLESPEIGESPIAEPLVDDEAFAVLEQEMIESIASVFAGEPGREKVMLNGNGDVSEIQMTFLLNRNFQLIVLSDFKFDEMGQPFSFHYQQVDVQTGIAGPLLTGSFTQFDSVGRPIEAKVEDESEGLIVKLEFQHPEEIGESRIGVLERIEIQRGGDVLVISAVDIEYEMTTSVNSNAPVEAVLAPAMIPLNTIDLNVDAPGMMPSQDTPTPINWDLDWEFIRAEIEDEEDDEEDDPEDAIDADTALTDMRAPVAKPALVAAPNNGLLEWEDIDDVLEAVANPPADVPEPNIVPEPEPVVLLGPKEFLKLSQTKVEPEPVLPNDEWGWTDTASLLPPALLAVFLLHGMHGRNTDSWKKRPVRDPPVEDQTPDLELIPNEDWSTLTFKISPAAGVSIQTPAQVVTTEILFVLTPRGYVTEDGQLEIVLNKESEVSIVNRNSESTEQTYLFITTNEDSEEKESDVVVQININKNKQWIDQLQQTLFAAKPTGTETLSSDDFIDRLFAPQPPVDDFPDTALGSKPSNPIKLLALQFLYVAALGYFVLPWIAQQIAVFIPEAGYSAWSILSLQASIAGTSVWLLIFTANVAVVLTLVVIAFHLLSHTPYAGDILAEINRPIQAFRHKTEQSKGFTYVGRHLLQAPIETMYSFGFRPADRGVRRLLSKQDQPDLLTAFFITPFLITGAYLWARVKMYVVGPWGRYLLMNAMGIGLSLLLGSVLAPGLVSAAVNYNVLWMDPSLGGVMGAAIRLFNPFDAASHVLTAFLWVGVIRLFFRSSAKEQTAYWKEALMFAGGLHLVSLEIEIVLWVLGLVGGPMLLLAHKIDGRESSVLSAGQEFFKHLLGPFGIDLQNLPMWVSGMTQADITNLYWTRAPEREVTVPVEEPQRNDTDGKIEKWKNELVKAEKESVRLKNEIISIEKEIEKAGQDKARMEKLAQAFRQWKAREWQLREFEKTFNEAKGKLAGQKAAMDGFEKQWKELKAEILKASAEKIAAPKSVPIADLENQYKKRDNGDEWVRWWTNYSRFAESKMSEIPEHWDDYRKQLQTGAGAAHEAGGDPSVPVRQRDYVEINHSNIQNVTSIGNMSDKALAEFGVKQTADGRYSVPGLSTPLNGYDLVLPIKGSTIHVVHAGRQFGRVWMESQLEQDKLDGKVAKLKTQLSEVDKNKKAARAAFAEKSQAVENQAQRLEKARTELKDDRDAFPQDGDGLQKQVVSLIDKEATLKAKQVAAATQLQLTAKQQDALRQTIADAEKALVQKQKENKVLEPKIDEQIEAPVIATRLLVPRERAIDLATGFVAGGIASAVGFAYLLIRRFKKKVSGKPEVAKIPSEKTFELAKEGHRITFTVPRAGYSLRSEADPELRIDFEKSHFRLEFEWNRKTNLYQWRPSSKKPVLLTARLVGSDFEITAADSYRIFYREASSKTKRIPIEDSALVSEMTRFAEIIVTQPAPWFRYAMAGASSIMSFVFMAALQAPGGPHPGELVLEGAAMFFLIGGTLHQFGVSPHSMVRFLQSFIFPSAMLGVLVVSNQAMGADESTWTKAFTEWLASSGVMRIAVTASLSVLIFVGWILPALRARRASTLFNQAQPIRRLIRKWAARGSAIVLAASIAGWFVFEGVSPAFWITTFGTPIIAALGSYLLGGILKILLNIRGSKNTSTALIPDESGPTRRDFLRAGKNASLIVAGFMAYSRVETLLLGSLSSRLKSFMENFQWKAWALPKPFTVLYEAVVEKRAMLNLAGTADPLIEAGDAGNGSTVTLYAQQEGDLIFDAEGGRISFDDLKNPKKALPVVGGTRLYTLKREDAEAVAATIENEIRYDEKRLAKMKMQAGSTVAALKIFQLEMAIQEKKAKGYYALQEADVYKQVLVPLKSGERGWIIRGKRVAGGRVKAESPLLKIHSENRLTIQVSMSTREWQFFDPARMKLAVYEGKRPILATVDTIAIKHQMNGTVDLTISVYADEKIFECDENGHPKPVTYKIDMPRRFLKKTKSDDVPVSAMIVAQSAMGSADSFPLNKPVKWLSRLKFIVDEATRVRLSDSIAAPRDHNRLAALLKQAQAFLKQGERELAKSKELFKKGAEIEFLPLNQRIARLKKRIQELESLEQLQSSANADGFLRGTFRAVGQHMQDANTPWIESARISTVRLRIDKLNDRQKGKIKSGDYVRVVRSTGEKRIGIVHHKVPKPTTEGRTQNVSQLEQYSVDVLNDPGEVSFANNEFGIDIQFMPDHQDLLKAEFIAEERNRLGRLNRSPSRPVVYPHVFFIAPADQEEEDELISRMKETARRRAARPDQKPEPKQEALVREQDGLPLETADSFGKYGSRIEEVLKEGNGGQRRSWFQRLDFDLSPDAVEYLVMLGKTDVSQMTLAYLASHDRLMELIRLHNKLYQKGNELDRTALARSYAFELIERGVPIAGGSDDRADAEVFLKSVLNMKEVATSPDTARVVRRIFEGTFWKGHQQWLLLARDLETSSKEGALLVRNMVFARIAQGISTGWSLGTHEEDARHSEPMKNLDPHTWSRLNNMVKNTDEAKIALAHSPWILLPLDPKENFRYRIPRSVYNQAEERYDSLVKEVSETELPQIRVLDLSAPLQQIRTDHVFKALNDRGQRAYVNELNHFGLERLLRITDRSNNDALWNRSERMIDRLLAYPKPEDVDGRVLLARVLIQVRDEGLLQKMIDSKFDETLAADAQQLKDHLKPSEKDHAPVASEAGVVLIYQQALITLAARLSDENRRRRALRSALLLFDDSEIHHLLRKQSEIGKFVRALFKKGGLDEAVFLSALREQMAWRSMTWALPLAKELALSPLRLLGNQASSQLGSAFDDVSDLFNAEKFDAAELERALVTGFTNHATAFRRLINMTEYRIKQFLKGPGADDVTRFDIESWPAWLFFLLVGGTVGLVSGWKTTRFTTKIPDLPAPPVPSKAASPARLNSFLWGLVVASGMFGGSAKLQANPIPVNPFPAAQVQVEQALRSMPDIEVLNLSSLDDRLVARRAENPQPSGLQIWEIQSEQEAQYVENVIRTLEQNRTDGFESTYVLMVAPGPQSDAEKIATLQQHVEQIQIRLNRKYRGILVSVVSHEHSTNEFQTVDFAKALQTLFAGSISSDPRVRRLAAAIHKRQVVLDLFATTEHWQPGSEIIVDGKVVSVAELIGSQSIHWVDVVNNMFTQVPLQKDFTDSFEVLRRVRELTEMST